MNNFRVVFVFKSITTPENIPEVPPGNCKIGTELKIVCYGPDFFLFPLENYQEKFFTPLFTILKNSTAKLDDWMNQTEI